MIMKRLVFQLSALLLVLLVAGCASPESEEPTENGEFEPRDLNTEYETIRLTNVVSGLEYPWAIAFLPDGRMLVTERPSRLNIIENGEVTEISGVPEVQAQNQGGKIGRAHV